MQLGILGVIIQLILLEGLLSIDNAAVLGAMVSVLPSDAPIPWPPLMRPVARLLNRSLGQQRAAALKVGLLGAYLGRGVMLLLAGVVVHNPWLRIIGALYLLKLAIDQLARNEPEEQQMLDALPRRRKFWRVVLAVELADLAFSLDNVVAAVALSDQIWVVMIGVALGILAMRFAAQIFTTLIEHRPILQTAAYILVLNIGIELLIEEFTPYEFTDITRFAISVLTIVLCLAYARFPAFHMIDPLLALICRLFGALDRILNLLLTPLTWLLSTIWQGATHLVRQIAGALQNSKM